MVDAVWILVSLVVVAALGWTLWRHFAEDEMRRRTDQWRSTSRVVGRAALIDGGHRIPVAMALTTSTLFYSNADLDASLDLKYVQEVEYDNESADGHSVASGKVMRLRCYSKIFEFELDAPSASQWESVFPPVRAAR